jgi:hypothetical protein
LGNLCEISLSIVVAPCMMHSLHFFLHYKSMKKQYTLEEIKKPIVTISYLVATVKIVLLIQINYPVFRENQNTLTITESEVDRYSF